MPLNDIGPLDRNVVWSLLPPFGNQSSRAKNHQFFCLKNFEKLATLNESLPSFSTDIFSTKDHFTKELKKLIVKSGNVDKLLREGGIIIITPSLCYTG